MHPSEKERLTSSLLDQESSVYRTLLALATETAAQEGYNAVGWNALYVLRWQIRLDARPGARPDS